MGSFASASYEKGGADRHSGGNRNHRYLSHALSDQRTVLGDEEAQSLGLKVERTRWIALVAVALISAAVVAAAGIVGWLDW